MGRRNGEGYYDPTAYAGIKLASLLLPHIIRHMVTPHTLDHIFLRYPEIRKDDFDGFSAQKHGISGTLRQNFIAGKSLKEDRD